MYIKGAIVVSMRHVAFWGKIVECDPFASYMPRGNGHASHNKHATDLVYFSKYCHCHCESLDNYVSSMHIKGAIIVSMRYTAWQGKILKCDPITSDMPLENDHISYNMHAKALVHISKDHHCHCEYIDIQNRSIPCILWDIWPFPWGMLPVIGSH